MMPDMTETQVIAKLRSRITGSQADAAREFGVSNSFLSEVLRGKRPPTGKLLDLLGLVRVVSYKRRS